MAVYSRCRSFGYVNRGCNLYLLDLASTRERRIRSTSARGRSELRPAFWGRRIAYVSASDRSDASRLVVRTLGGDRRP